MTTQIAWLTYDKSTPPRTLKLCDDDGNHFMGTVAGSSSQDFQVQRSDGDGCGNSDGCKLRAISFYFGEPTEGQVAETFQHDDISPNNNFTPEIDDVQVTNISFGKGSWIKFTVVNNCKPGGVLSFQVTIQDGDRHYTSRDPQINVEPSG